MPTLAGEGSTSRLWPEYKSITYKYASEIDTDFSTRSFRSSGDQSSGYQSALSPVTTSRGSDPASGSTTSMSWLTPSRAVLKNARSRPAFDHTGPPFRDLPSVNNFAVGS